MRYKLMFNSTKEQKERVYQFEINRTLDRKEELDHKIVERSAEVFESVIY
jgi:hypothetical protein